MFSQISKLAQIMLIFVYFLKIFFWIRRNNKLS